MIDRNLLRTAGRPKWPAPLLQGQTILRKGLLTGVLAGGLVAIAVFFGGVHETRALEEKGRGPDSSTPVVTSKEIRHPREKTFLKRTWGVEVIFVRQTAAGNMLEFRYKVLNPEKAKPLFERRTKPVLTHAETGAKLIVPTPAKTGALRNSNPPIAGRIYWMFFANTGRLVKPGEHVSIEIGKFRVDGLVVQ